MGKWELLRFYRKRCKKTQSELAELLDVHEMTIRRWESGEREPRASDITKLCEALGCTEAELLNGPQVNEWKINICWEVDDMQVLDIKKDEFAIGFRDSGDIMMWGCIPVGLSLEEASDRIRRELAVAHKMRETGQAERKKMEGE